MAQLVGQKGCWGAAAQQRLANPALAPVVVMAAASHQHQQNKLSNTVQCPAIANCRQSTQQQNGTVRMAYTHC
jgi:hypothetical protein